MRSKWYTERVSRPISDESPVRRMSSLMRLFPIGLVALFFAASSCALLDDGVVLTDGMDGHWYNCIPTLGEDYFIGTILVVTGERPAVIESVKFVEVDGVELVKPMWSEIEQGDDLVGVQSVSFRSKHDPVWDRRMESETPELAALKSYNLIMQLRADPDDEAYFKDVDITYRGVDGRRKKNLVIETKIEFSPDAPNCPSFDPPSPAELEMGEASHPDEADS